MLSYYDDYASPYTKRKEQVYSKPGGRPVGTTAKTTPTGSGIAPEMGQSPYAGFLKGLTEPLQYENRYQQRFNLARGGIQSATRTALEQAKSYMGGKGFRAGESGIADAPISAIATKGAETLSRAGLEIGESEAAKRAEYDRMELQRKMGGAQIALSGEEGALDRMMRYYEAKLGAETREWQPWWAGISGG